jgi:hypothetical protein
VHDKLSGLSASYIFQVSNHSYSATLCSQVNTLDEHEWHRLEQAHVLANVQQAFNDGGAAGADMNSEDVDDAMFASGDMLSPSLAPAGSTDAHTMALILQQQLDAINNEIRCVKSLFVSFRFLPGVLRLYATAQSTDAYCFLFCMSCCLKNVFEIDTWMAKCMSQQNFHFTRFEVVDEVCLLEDCS